MFRITQWQGKDATSGKSVYSNVGWIDEEDGRVRCKIEIDRVIQAIEHARSKKADIKYLFLDCYENNQDRQPAKTNSSYADSPF